jgi:hypothetical protein
MTAVPADAHALSLSPHGNTSPHLVNDADDFVTGSSGILNAWPQAFFCEYVTVANTTRLYLDSHLSRTGFRNLTLHDFEISARFGNLRHRHYFFCYSFGCHRLPPVNLGSGSLFPSYAFVPMMIG